jgi:outer membrane protein assembly factor BamB
MKLQPPWIAILLVTFLSACPRGLGTQRPPDVEVLSPKWSQARSKYLRSGPVPRGELAWKRPCKGPITTSAAVSDGVVYFAASVSGQEEKGYLYALDQVTGEPRWETLLSGWSRSAPDVASRRLYLGSRSGMVHCVKTISGEEVWSFKAGTRVSSSGKIWEDLFVIGTSEGKIYGLEAATGKPRWEYATGKLVDSTPVVHQGILYMGSHDNQLHALNPVSGKRLWTFETRGDIVAMPVLDANRIYVASFDGNVYVLNSATGKHLWTYRVGSPIFGLAAYKSIIYAVSATTGIHAFEAQSGKPVWTASLGKESGRGAPAVVDDVLYTTTHEGTILALDAKTGKERWRYKTGGRIIASPVVNRGLVLVGSLDGNFYALK